MTRSKTICWCATTSTRCGGTLCYSFDGYQSPAAGIAGLNANGYFPKSPSSNYWILILVQRMMSADDGFVNRLAVGKNTVVVVVVVKPMMNIYTPTPTAFSFLIVVVDGHLDHYRIVKAENVASTEARRCRSKHSYDTDHSLYNNVCVSFVHVSMFALARLASSQ